MAADAMRWVHAFELGLVTCCTVLVVGQGWRRVTAKPTPPQLWMLAGALGGAVGWILVQA